MWQFLWLPWSYRALSSKVLLLSKHSRLLHRCQIKSSTISGAPCHLKRCGNRSFRTVFCRTWSQKAFLSSLHRIGQRRTQEEVVNCHLTSKVNQDLLPSLNKPVNRRVSRKKQTDSLKGVRIWGPRPWSRGAGLQPLGSVDVMRYRGLQTQQQESFSPAGEGVARSWCPVRPPDAQLSTRSCMTHSG